ncbi:phosphatase PAP2 family protein [Tatumella sp. TA1]|uniref:phosphatase PAP2 family protein n=1 Tax=Rosenbergiella collisarenosi TaxID=1544695 RepID=UPI0008F919F2|nr:phosphatase PAP2 family protein [Rosenbergiella collisarenosi]MBT0720651.1 phosphatase PAP2 family protein [Rosenbergiella collisarenosi]QGX91773.1 phosphatase PAP2 family protein [Tatumella sp. TA1]
MHWQTLTFFGDSMLLLPSAVVMAFALFYNTSRFATVIAWLGSFGVAGLVVSISKVLFLGFLIGSARYNFTGFSGHTTMSTTFWPIFFWFIARGFALKRPLTLVFIGYLFALAIAYSRLVLHAHSPSEVISGFLLGACCSLAFLALQRKVAFKPINAVELIIIIALPLTLFLQGKPATTQHFLGTLAAKIAGMEHPHTRQQLLSLDQ